MPPRHGTRQRKFEKKLKKSLPGASDMAPGKARDDGAGAVTTTFLCRVPGLHSAKSLSGARRLTLDKELFAVKTYAECRLPSVTLDKPFAECSWHTAKLLFLVVNAKILGEF